MRSARSRELILFPLLKNVISPVPVFSHLLIIGSLFARPRESFRSVVPRILRGTGNAGIRRTRPRACSKTNTRDTVYPPPRTHFRAYRARSRWRIRAARGGASCVHRSLTVPTAAVLGQPYAVVLSPSFRGRHVVVSGVFMLAL